MIKYDIINAIVSLSLLIMASRSKIKLLGKCIAFMRPKLSIKQEEISKARITL